MTIVSAFVPARRSLAVALLACAIGTACERPRGEGARSAAAARSPASNAQERTVAPASGAELRDAERALVAFLDASRERSAISVDIDTLMGCGADEGGYLPSPLLAAFTVLPITGGGDTLVARALVITVAEQDVDRRAPGRFVARQRVRADTLEWDLVRSGPGSAWRVCNGLQFGYVGADSLTTWRPDGASIGSARALADSIHHAWKERRRGGA